MMPTELMWALSVLWLVGMASGVYILVHLDDNQTIYYMIKDPDELTDEQLENVIGGASREVFLNWAADIYNAHRKKQYDKKTNEERKWTRND